MTLSRRNVEVFADTIRWIRPRSSSPKTPTYPWSPDLHDNVCCCVVAMERLGMFWGPCVCVCWCGGEGGSSASGRRAAGVFVMMEGVFFMVREVNGINTQLVLVQDADLTLDNKTGYQNIDVCNFCATIINFKGLLHPKINILTLFTYPHVVPTP